MEEALDLSSDRILNDDDENRVRGKPEKRQFGRSRCRREGNIETDLKLNTLLSN